MKNVFITGASGFIGQALCRALSASKYNVFAAVRNSNIIKKIPNIEYVSIGDLNSNIDWRKLLSNIDCIIHCAGRAHNYDHYKNNSFGSYQSINTDFTKKIAEQGALAGVKRFIFLSSIGVHGLNTNKRSPFLYSDIPNALEDYSISKLAEEKEIFEISRQTGLKVVIIRSPLVYGKSPPGNLKKLLNLIKLRVPLPFGLVKNRRSFVGIDNLVDLLIHCIDHPEAVGKIFLVSDDHDISTTEFIKLIANEMGKSSLLFPLPISILKFFGFAFKKQREIDKLTGSFQVDISYTKSTLKWSPSVSISEGIKRMLKSPNTLGE